MTSSNRGASAAFLIASLSFLTPHPALAQLAQQGEEAEPLAPLSNDCKSLLAPADPDCIAQKGVAAPNLDGAITKSRSYSPDISDPADSENPRLHMDPAMRLDRTRMTSADAQDEDSTYAKPKQKRPGERTPQQPPSEFQRFVESSTGRLLPIFGSSLFDDVPSTFAPLDRIPVTSDYLIGPGDEIMLRVWGQVTMNRQLTVDRSGAIYIPQVGQVTVSGLQFQQLDSYLRHQLARVYRNFEMTVGMG